MRDSRLRAPRSINETLRAQTRWSSPASIRGPSAHRLAPFRPLGHLTIVGIGGGTVPVSFFGIAYEASVATTYWGSIPELIEVISLAAAAHIRAHIQCFDLKDAPAAYQALRDGKLEGRAVIVPS